MEARIRLGAGVLKWTPRVQKHAGVQCFGIRDAKSGITDEARSSYKSMGR